MASKADAAKSIRRRIAAFEHDKGALPGLGSEARAQSLGQQFVDSIRRVEFARHIRTHSRSARFADSNDDMFDPLRGAVWQNDRGNSDEAYWLVFLATHFGKHHVDGWRLARDFYRALGNSAPWTWDRISAHIDEFDDWAEANIPTMKADGVKRRYSNHRKYESLDHVPAVFRSYVEWIAPFGGHRQMVRLIHNRVGQEPKAVFAELYKGMGEVRQFGRLAKFDHLAMLGKLGISPIEPDSAYLSNATGPIRGARLLFGGSVNSTLVARELQARLDELDRYLEVGMQVLEDALCNWQKSPESYIQFKG